MQTNMQVLVKEPKPEALLAEDTGYHSQPFPARRRPPRKPHGFMQPLMLLRHSADVSHALYRGRWAQRERSISQKR